MIQPTSDRKPSACPEITWSVMHPTFPDPVYMRRVIAESRRYRVDSFEICGECHGLYGGLEGVLSYEPYPQFQKVRDPEAVAVRRRVLQEIIAACHAAGKPAYFWHREVMLPRELAGSLPGVFDADGELDLLGPEYARLLEYKIAAAFEALPELDGIVLTLTEADFSVLHNSNPDHYPPEKVVARMAGIFAAELSRRGKRFILRTFGSIPRDYEDILAGAAVVARSHSFELETKVTPYDFDPFLPINPYLRRVPGATVGVECDSLGEFLGAGHLPACNVDRIVGYVRAGQQAGADRFVIRIDRVGKSIFDSAYEINLHAYHRAIEDLSATADTIHAEWAASRWPGCEVPMREVLDAGMPAIERLNFIAGNVIFHTLPLDPSLRWVKAGGIFALFHEGVPLSNLSGIWSILPERTTPARREQIIEEKAGAHDIAARCLATIAGMEHRLPPAILKPLRNEWENARQVARLYRAFCEVVAAYFSGIDRLDFAGATLDLALTDTRPLFAEFLEPKELANEAHDQAERHAYHGLFDIRDGSIRSVFAYPLWCMLRELREEYAAESRARQAWGQRAGVVDIILPGAITEEWRIRRYMHASHSKLAQGKVWRTVGNPVFPNGFVEFDLACSPKAGARLLVEVNPASAARMKITVGEEIHVVSSATGQVEIPLAPVAAGTIRVRLEKSGAGYPDVGALVVLAKE